jgi:hypothetical protein
METFSIATIITTIGTILTGVLGWFASILTFAVGQPIILFYILVPIVLGLIASGIALAFKRRGKKKRAA